MSIIKLFHTGIAFALGVFTLPGWEYFCPRRVFPRSRAEYLKFQKYSRPGRVKRAASRIPGWGEGFTH
jgi:hypothetical protein